MNDRLIEVLKLEDYSVIPDISKELERNPSVPDIKSVNEEFLRLRELREAEIKKKKLEKLKLNNEIFELEREKEDCLRQQCIILNKLLVGKRVKLPVIIVSRNTYNSRTVQVEHLKEANVAPICFKKLFEVHSDKSYMKLQILDFNVNFIKLLYKENRQFRYKSSHLEEFLTNYWRHNER